MPILLRGHGMKQIRQKIADLQELWWIGLWGFKKFFFLGSCENLRNDSKIQTGEPIILFCALIIHQGNWSKTKLFECKPVLKTLRLKFCGHDSSLKPFLVFQIMQIFGDQSFLTQNSLNSSRWIAINHQPTTVILGTLELVDSRNPSPEGSGPAFPQPRCWDFQWLCLQLHIFLWSMVIFCGSWSFIPETVTWTVDRLPLCLASWEHLC